MRERLIELLNNLDVYNCEECQNCPSFKYNLECDDNCFTAKVADYMRAMGVTFVVHGRWGELDYDFDEDKYTKPCSNCGYKSTEYLKSYCPYCGARMDGE